MSIQNSILALSSHRTMMSNRIALTQSLERLSSGLQINRAADNAAGLAVSERMRADTMGFTAASRNVQDGMSVVRTAEGALTETHSMLNRMTELAAQASNGILNDQQRGALNAEFQELRSEINRIASSTNFNGRNLLDGSLENGMSLQIGNTGEAHNRISVSINNMGTAGLGLDDIDISTFESAQAAMGAVRDAVNVVSEQRGSLGAMENRQQHTFNNLGVMIENITAAQSRIRDADMALEMMNFTRSNIMMQSSQAMLAQANVMAGSVINLLR